MNTPSYPLFRLPEKQERIIALLREELKAGFFFRGLTRVGLDDCQHEPFMGTVILRLIGFKSCPDEVMDFYLDRLNHYVKKIKPDYDPRHLSKTALHLYGELRMKRKETLKR